MNLKKSKPFIPHSKEHEIKHRRFTRRLFCLVALCSLLLPLLIDGVLSYVHEMYIYNNYALYFLDVFLQFFIKFASSASKYVAYAVIAISAVRLGKGLRSGYFGLIIAGTVFSNLIIGYTVTCLCQGYVMFDAADYDSFFAFLYALSATILFVIKDIVLITLSVKKIKRYPTTNLPVSDKGIFSHAFNFDKIYFKLSFLFFSVSLSIDIIINAISAGADIIMGGLPEQTAHYIYLLSPFGTALIQNLIGLFVMAVMCVLLDKMHLSYRDDEQMKEIS